VLDRGCNIHFVVVVVVVVVLVGSLLMFSEKKTRWCSRAW
jgi:hypothetical protein